MEGKLSNSLKSHTQIYLPTITTILLIQKLNHSYLIFYTKDLNYGELDLHFQLISDFLVLFLVLYYFLLMLFWHIANLSCGCLFYYLNNDLKILIFIIERWYNSLNVIVMVTYHLFWTSILSRYWNQDLSFLHLSMIWVLWHQILMLNLIT